MAEDPEWRFHARAVLATFEATRLPSWLGGRVVSRGPAAVRARRAVARTYPAVRGGDAAGERGLVGAVETDPRRTVTAEPFTEETETGVRCGYEFRFAVAVDRASRLAVWPAPEADRATVRAALADEIATTLAGVDGTDPPASVTVEPVGR